jgi:hypothetical protein
MKILLHTQEVAGSSPAAPTIPALANQQLAILTPEHFLFSFSKTYQNRIKTRSVPYHGRYQKAVEETVAALERQRETRKVERYKDRVRGR